MASKTSNDRADKEIRLLLTLTLAISESQDLHAALELVLRQICETTGWILGQAWIPHPEGKHLECSSAWYSSSDGLGKFRTLSEGFQFSPGSALPGLVWSSKHVVWIRDVTLDANFPRAATAREVGLKGAMGIPILAQDQVVAVLEFFVREPREEDDHLVQLVSAVAAQLGSLIQRKQTEEKLNLYRQLVENSQGLICVHDLEGNLLLMNPAGAEVLGYQPEEIIGKNLRELAAPEVRHEVQTYLGRIRKYNTHSGLMRVVTGKGEQRVLFYRNSLHEETGKPAYVLGHAQDVTVLMQAEKALRESEEKFRSIVETTHEWIWSIDLQGHHTYCNPAVETILGYSPEELLGKDSLSYMHEEDRRRVQEMLPTVIRQKRGWTGLLIRWRHKNGDYRFLESNAIPILDSKGELAGFRGTDRDITERKRAEESMLALQKAVETMQLGVTITDMEGKIIYTNPAETRMHGHRKEELIGKDSRIFSPPEYWKPIPTEQMKAVRSWGRESVNMRKDGTTFPVQLLSDIVTNPAGQPVSIVTTCEDITERKRTEDVMARFVAGVAHEVRNPLYAIQTGVQTLQLDLNQDPEYGSLLEVIFSQVERLSHLMKDLLELGRPTKTYARGPESLSCLCRSIAELWNQTPAGRTHSLKLDAALAESLKVNVDTARVQQVLLNLLDNAAQHSPVGSEILLNIAASGSTASVRITDQGIGVAKESLPLIFDPFFTTRTQGTGLGLALVKHIVEAHNGKVILCNNDPPPGCTVEVMLPLFDSARTAG